MLNIDRDRFIDAAELEPAIGRPARMPPSVSILASLRKRAATSAAIVLGFMALGLGYALTSTPLYTASTDILIDARRSHAGEAGASNRSLAELGMDPASIDSQVAVLGSEKIATDALKQLHLERDAEFAAPTTLPGAWLRNLRHALGRDRVDDGGSGVPTDILEGFMKNVDVKRVQQTYVLSLSFAARTPERAATIVNTMANVYTAGQAQAALESHERSDGWLKERVATVHNELAAADQAVRSLRAEMGLSTGGASLVPPDPDRLRGLERNLDNKRVLYAALVDRLNASLQQQSMPVSDASVLKPARAPERKSQPNTALVLALSTLAGLAAAVGLATWREFADGTFKLPSQVEADLGLHFLGMLPRVNVGRTGRRSILKGNWAARQGGRTDKVEQASSEAQAVVSRFSGTLRAVSLAADGGSLRDKLAVIGVTSALPGEGRTTVAINLAGVIARSGRRTLVIDANLRNPDLGRACASSPQGSLLEVMTGSLALKAAVARDEVAGVDVLAASGTGTTDAGLVLGIDDLEAVLAQARDGYEAVVLDLPPLAALTEVATIAPAIGAFVLVVKWGHTERAVVAEALASVPAVAGRMVGAVLNGADPKAVRRLAREPRDVFYVTAMRHSQDAAA